MTDHEDGPNKKKWQKHGGTVRHCYWCNKRTSAAGGETFSWVIQSAEGRIAVISDRDLSLNKKKRWEIDENKLLFSTSGEKNVWTKEGGKLKRIGDKTEEKNSTEGGRQAKKAARQERAKQQNGGGRKNHGKLESKKAVAESESASSSEEEESWEREEKIEATKKMLLYGKNTNDRFKARAICFTCNGSSGYGSWGETTRAGRKNQFAKDIIDNM